MKRLIAGASLSLLMGCYPQTGTGERFLADNNEPEKGIGLTAMTDVLVFDKPNTAVEKEKIAVIKAGHFVTAICYEESAALASDEVRVAGSRKDGYAFVQSMDTTAANPVSFDNFHVSAGVLANRLPAC